MKDNRLYQDIAKRTDGDIYVGVVGPVRTGKSTFIKRFMEPDEEMPILTVEEACENLKNFGKKLKDVMGKGEKK